MATVLIPARGRWGRAGAAIDDRLRRSGIAYPVPARVLLVTRAERFGRAARP
jgi:hypothetical protein